MIIGYIPTERTLNASCGPLTITSLFDQLLQDPRITWLVGRKNELHEIQVRVRRSVVEIALDAGLSISRSFDVANAVVEHMSYSNGRVTFDGDSIADRIAEPRMEKGTVLQ